MASASEEREIIALRMKSRGREGKKRNERKRRNDYEDVCRKR